MSTKQFGNRVNIYANDITHARMRSTLESLGMGLSEVLAAIFTVMPEDQIKDIVVRYRSTKDLEKEVGEVLAGQMLKLIKGKSEADLRKILAAAQAASGSDA